MLSKAVAKILDELSKEPCTPKQLVQHTGLAGRTVSFHLRNLLQKNPPLIEKWWNLEDARQAVYSIIKSEMQGTLKS